VGEKFKSSQADKELNQSPYTLAKCFSHKPEMAQMSSPETAALSEGPKWVEKPP